jgi:hypothetical protein
MMDYLDASQAAEIRHSVITAAKTIGSMKRKAKLTAVIRAKQRANAQVMPRKRAKVSFGSPPSCQASMAENK